MVKKAWEAGINFIDTADLYTQGVSEIMVGKALKDLTIPRHAIILATKANVWTPMKSMLQFRRS